MSNLKSYRACFVPFCKNTTKITPEKMILNVPQDVKLRNQWFKAVRRINPKTTSNYFCCEDHFDIPDDVENYIRLKLMGEGKVRIKKGVVPHKNLPEPISLREEPNTRKTILQSQKKGIKQMHVGNLERVDECQTVKKLKQAIPLTGKKQNNEEFIKQMNVKRLKKIDDDDKQMQTSDCTNYFIEKKRKVRILKSNLCRSKPVISGYKTVCLQNDTEINRPVVALNSVECNVQNVSDNKVILEISDPNNILSNLHGLTDQYSAVIEQVIDKNDIKTHIVLCKKDTSEKISNETNSGKLQETNDKEMFLPDVKQENIENECAVESEIDTCEEKIKIEKSETDVMDIKLEPEECEEFLQEQVDRCPFERDNNVNEKKIKRNEFRETESLQIKVETKEESDERCLSHV